MTETLEFVLLTSGVLAFYTVAASIVALDRWLGRKRDNRVKFMGWI